jgi:hypothetical protein
MKCPSFFGSAETLFGAVAAKISVLSKIWGIVKDGKLIGVGDDRKKPPGTSGWPPLVPLADIFIKLGRKEQVCRVMSKSGVAGYSNAA